MAAAARTAIRSAAIRKVASRISAGAQPSASPFRFPNKKTLSHRIFRSPVEMSSCVDSMLPYHMATASALLTSMLSATRTYGWTLEVILFTLHVLEVPDPNLWVKDNDIVTNYRVLGGATDLRF